MKQVAIFLVGAVFVGGVLGVAGVLIRRLLGIENDTVGDVISGGLIGGGIVLYCWAAETWRRRSMRGGR